MSLKRTIKKQNPDLVYRFDIMTWILSEVYDESSIPEFQDFIDDHKVGVPLAYLVARKLIDKKAVSEKGLEAISKAYYELCIWLQVSPTAFVHTDLESLVMSSPVVDLGKFDNGE